MNRPIYVGLATDKSICLIVALILLALAGRLATANAQTVTNLHSFAGPTVDGTAPQAGLPQASDGNFYGTTVNGGTSGLGTVFRISPSGSETNLHSFAGPPSDGEFPNAGLVQGSDGDFYGTTLFGGTNNRGTVFRISPSGSNTILQSFIGPPTDGGFPVAGLVQGSDGYFYGTTENGGTSTNCGSGRCGTVFRISPTGSSTILHSFSGYPDDGGFPEAVLVQSSDGSFYGTTEAGGTGDNGTVFKLTVPLDPPPYPINQIIGVQVPETNIVFNIVSIAGETYQLQFRDSLTSGDWSNIPSVSVTNSIGALLSLTNFGGAVGPQGFYRFTITP